MPAPKARALSDQAGNSGFERKTVTYNLSETLYYRVRGVHMSDKLHCWLRVAIAIVLRQAPVDS